MYIVTGAIGSGTSLVSQYMEHLGIKMVDKTIIPTMIHEDPRYYDVILNMLTKQELKKFAQLIDVDIYKKYWGFKVPIAIRIIDPILSICLKKTPVTVIHVFRDFNETLDCCTLRKHLPISNRNTVLLNHVYALTAYSRWRHLCQFFVVYIRDVVNFPYKFWELLGTDLSYKPLSEVYRRDRKSLLRSDTTFMNDEIFELLLDIKWRP